MAHAHKLEIFRGLIKFKSNTQKIWPLGHAAALHFWPHSIFTQAGDHTQPPTNKITG